MPWWSVALYVTLIDYLIHSTFMSSPIPAAIQQQLSLAHPSWQAALTQGLEAVHAADPNYLPTLAQDDYLPTQGRLFAAFTQALEQTRYVLIGEGPYPREASATGVCFMDGAVESLWSEKGLSKQVNRATSLRNFIKMLLVANGTLQADNTSGEAMQPVAIAALAAPQTTIQTGQQLQDNLQANGFLLLNASLVFRKHVPPVKDARAWKPFVEVIIHALFNAAQTRHTTPPTLILWGKIAELLKTIAITQQFPQAISEHPYNLSFIHHRQMQQLFGPLNLLTTPA
jgi:uracil-DNA glycosylase